MSLGSLHGILLQNSAPTVTYLGRGGGPFNIGPARPDRLIVAFSLWESDAGNTINNVNIGGALGTNAYAPTTSDPLAIAYRLVPTGTTVTIAPSAGGCMGAVMITGLASGSLAGGTAVSGASNLTESLTAPPGYGVVLCFARSRSGSAPFSCGGTSASVAFDTANNGGGGNPGWVIGGAIQKGVNGAVTVIQFGSYSAGLGWAGMFV